VRELAPLAPVWNARRSDRDLEGTRHVDSESAGSAELDWRDVRRATTCMTLYATSSYDPVVQGAPEQAIEIMIICEALLVGRSVRKQGGGRWLVIKRSSAMEPQGNPYPAAASHCGPDVYGPLGHREDE
jgi:hypothetical protein